MKNIFVRFPMYRTRSLGPPRTLILRNEKGKKAKQFLGPSRTNPFGVASCPQLEDSNREVPWVTTVRVGHFTVISRIFEFRE